MIPNCPYCRFPIRGFFLVCLICGAECHEECCGKHEHEQHSDEERDEVYQMIVHVNKNVGFNLPARFWSKVNKLGPDECWPWTGSKDEKGYGLFRYNGRVIRCMRLLLMSLGHDMTGKVGRHTCDNPTCCNPAHGIPGTNLENIRDCVQRGRRAPSHGSRNNFAKLSEDKVIEIRQAYKLLPKSAGGYTKDGEAKNIANYFGISYRNLMQIVNCKSWTHI